MITAIAVALGVVAIGLAVLVRRQTMAVSGLRQQAALREQHHTEALATARSREQQSLEALGAAEAELDSLRADLADARAHAAELDAEIEAADQLAEHQSAELASMAIESEELRRKLAGAELDLAVARKQTEQVSEQFEQLRSGRGDASAVSTVEQADDGPRPTDVGADGDESSSRVDVASLWRLELARSERTWRYSVAILPDDPSPYAESNDPLKLAIETEASALRDDVGAFISVDVADGISDDPATALLTLRIAQEILAAAARLDEPTRLSVQRRDDEIEFSLVPTDDGDVLDLDLAELVHRSMDHGITAEGGSVRVLVA